MGNTAFDVPEVARENEFDSIIDWLRWKLKSVNVRHIEPDLGRILDLYVQNSSGIVGTFLMKKFYGSDSRSGKWKKYIRYSRR